MSEPVTTYEIYEVSFRGHSESWRKSVRDRDSAIEYMRQCWDMFGMKMYARISVSEAGKEVQWVGELTRLSKKSSEISPQISSV